jgi:hypothetical protein
MRDLVLKAMANRKRLNKKGLSHPDFRSEQFMKNMGYWLANGADVFDIIKNHEPELRIMMTTNFKKRFDMTVLGGHIEKKQ